MFPNRAAIAALAGPSNNREHNVGGHITWTFSWPATIPPFRKGLVPAVMSSAARLWKTLQAKANSIPGSAESCSASARIPVRLQPGILFGINAESCSASPRNRVRLAPDSALWYSIRPKTPDKTPITVEALKAENEQLKKNNAELIAKLADIDRRLEFWRKRFDQPVPGSEEELKKVLYEAGRGKPKCQDNNVILDVAVINGATTLTIIADCPELRTTLEARGVEFQPGTTVTNPATIDAVLRAARDSANRQTIPSAGSTTGDYILAQ